jgi:hypothetical protein
MIGQKKRPLGQRYPAASTYLSLLSRRAGCREADLTASSTSGKAASFWMTGSRPASMPTPLNYRQIKRTNAGKAVSPTYAKAQAADCILGKVFSYGN